jgi:S1-C subfamily serine protease
MITANFIHRTFRIKCGDSVGTGFTVDVDGKQYLVTAKHVVQAFGTSAQLEVFGNGAWFIVPATLVAHGAEGLDVSVLAPTASMSPPNLPVMASSDGLTYGQDVYFLGFPYGVLSRIIFGDTGHPLPLVKKALFSTFAGDIYLLDGHNNPGFSGGPVVFARSGGIPTSIAAVVSGYRFSPEPVFFAEAETDLFFRENTGIIITYKIETAIALIRSNPIGAFV